MDADTKLCVAWMVGGRDAGAAHAFVHDLSERLANRVQLTTGGHKVCLTAVESDFGADIDDAMLVKIYGNDRKSDARCSPAESINCKPIAITGTPDPKHFSTSYVERQNLTMRRGMRSFTRLTNAFSKKVENHAYAIALHFMYYNFCRVLQTLRVTPAMQTGIADHAWNMEEIIELLDDKTERPGPRGPLTKREFHTDPY